MSDTERGTYSRGGIFSALYDGIASLGEGFSFCCSFLLHLILKLFKKPVLFFLGALRSLFGKIGGGLNRLLHDENGNKRYFTGRMNRSVKRVLSLLPRHPIEALRAFYGYADKGSRVYAPVIRGLLCTVIPLVSLGAVIFTVNTLSQYSTALMIEADGRLIGCVADESVYFRARSLAESRISPAGGLLPDIGYSLSLIPAAELTDEKSLADSLIKESDISAVTACGIYIDGDFLCAAESEATARRIFKAKTDSFEAENKDDIIGFVEEITYETGLYPDSSRVLWSTDKLARRVESDSSLLTLKAVRTVVETHTVSYPTVYIETDSLVLGSQRTVVEGKDGVDQVTSFVTFVDGEEISANEVSRLTVIAPVTKRIQTGTRETGEDEPYGYYGGVLIWPTIGATNINSTYGYRWGKLHAGIDIGCAYGSSYGKSVVAAAEGTVIISSYNSLSGYYVKIDHGNGLQTLYAHMQQGSVRVNAGDRVYAGEQIGKIGATGYVTGSHLHFEVWKNGSKVNPGAYLGLY